MGFLSVMASLVGLTTASTCSDAMSPVLQCEDACEIHSGKLSYYQVDYVL